MDEILQAQIDAYRLQIEGLIRRGSDLQVMLDAGPSDIFAITTNRVWQQDCGVIVNELSGGSKAHWLARSFSEAFLLRTDGGHAVEEAEPAEIVRRLLVVLERGLASLALMEKGSVPEEAEQLVPRRFEFVHNVDLRPVLEKAYAEGRRAFQSGHYDLALQTSCGIMEAIVTDALENKGLIALVSAGAPAGNIADWSFETRLTVAERAGLIRGGWARLPEVAWTYRDQNESSTKAVTERDARVAGQVLNVVMRDLNPGR
jgi:hypothetical protein